MAIPGIPQGFLVQTANQENLISWSLSTGATSYDVQRSLDNVTFTTIATVSGTPLATSYLDADVALATQYWYQVNARNSDFSGDLTISTATVTNIASTTGMLPGRFITGIGIPSNTTILTVDSATQITLTQNALVTATAALLSNSTSSFTTPQSVVPTPTGEMCLSQIRLAAMQRADRVNSNFVSIPEWRSYINQAMFELYDLLVSVYEDYYIATPVQFPITDSNTFLYPLPNGSNTFQNALNPGQTFTPQPFYKLIGVDLALNNATNAYVTINKFNFIDRNRYVYPNTASTIYGVFNLQYRVMGSNIEFIPTPSAGQQIRLWYIPRLTELLQDTDTTTTGISGWIEYVIVRAAKYALDKEESDSSKLTEEIMFLKGRIEEMAANRDAGQPDKISDTRGNNGGWGQGWGGGSGPIGGW